MEHFLIGYLLNKAGILRAESNSVISELIVKVTVPMLVISSVCNTGEADDKGQIIKIFFIGIIFSPFFLCFILIGDFEYIVQARLAPKDAPLILLF